MNYKENRWAKTEEEFVLSNYLDLTWRQIAQELGRTEGAVRIKARKLGAIKRRHNLWTKKEIKQLKMLYPISSLQELLDAFPDRNKDDIWSKAKGLGITKTEKAKSRSHREKSLIYSINEQFFSRGISSPDHAVLFGFILADGYFNDAAKAVRIKLKKDDRTYLNKIKDLVGSDKGVYQFDSEPWAVTLDIQSPLIFRDLKSMCTFTNKSLDLRYPKIMKGHRYELDFIRGLFEGNGGVKMVKSPSKCREFSYSFHVTFGSRDVVKNIQKALIDNCLDGGRPALTKTKIYDDQRTDYGYSVEYSNYSSAIIGYWLYASVFSGKSSLYMQRKLDRFRSLWDEWKFNPPPELQEIY